MNFALAAKFGGIFAYTVAGPTDCLPTTDPSQVSTLILLLP